MKFSLMNLVLLITCVCVGLGCYVEGRRQGMKDGHENGYDEAKDRYRVMLAAHAENRYRWDYIGNLWREYPDMNIINECRESKHGYAWNRYAGGFIKSNSAIWDMIDKLEFNNYDITDKSHPDEIPWKVKVPTKDHLGNEVDILLFPEPLTTGGYVVNISTQDDKIRGDGTCRGTVIFKGEVLK